MSQARRLDGKTSGQGPMSRLESIVSLFVEAGRQWQEDNAMRLSAAVSYYAVLSLAPLLAIVIRAMGLAHASQFAHQQMIKLATNLMGQQAGDAIRPIIESNGPQSTGSLATVISTVVLLYSATRVFIELRDSMNSIWGVEFKAHQTHRAEHIVLTFIRTRLLSLAMVFGLGFLLVLSMFISGILTAFQQHIGAVDQWPGYLAAVAVSCTVEFAVFGVLFKFLPDMPMRWKNVWLGALVAAILFSAGRFGLSIYFKYSRINSVYGAAGSLVAVLTWIFYSTFSIFYGAEFAKVWTRRRPSSPASLPARKTVAR